VGACSSAPSPLHPASARADDLRWFWWLLCAVSVAVFIAVAAILIWGVMRAPTPEEESRDHPFGTHLVWFGGIIIPLLILGGVFALSVARMVTAEGSSSDIPIDVIGHQWWWEVRYPNGITTANEIHLPVGRRALIHVTSSDVIHGFWVPQLQGKVDAIPGQTNTIDLLPSQSGSYRGMCLVFCALQHANMNFLVIAQAQNDFDSWLKNQAAVPAAPTDSQVVTGQRIFLQSACASCHTVAGTSAVGTEGPNLTHLASRQQLAAGTIPNTPETLSTWVVDPQSIKPGNRMPNEDFSGSDLQALLAYLESLK
jgi:cytochrome c oxidase subunit 2